MMVSNVKNCLAIVKLKQKALKLSCFFSSTRTKTVVYLKMTQEKVEWICELGHDTMGCSVATP